MKKTRIQSTGKREKKSRSTTRDSQRVRKREEQTTKRYQVRALGYCVEVTAHKLSKKEISQVKEWCEREGHDLSDMSGSLEEALDGYNCYSTNLWQSGIVPILGSVRFVVVDEHEHEILTISKPTIVEAKCPAGDVLSVDKGEGDVLVYFEEYKGLVATWVFSSTSKPKVKDFSISADKITVAGEETKYVDGVYFCGEELERDYDYESIRGKAAYSALL